MSNGACCGITDYVEHLRHGEVPDLHNIVKPRRSTSFHDPKADPFVKPKTEELDRWIVKRRRQGMLGSDAMATQTLLQEGLGKGDVNHADETGTTALHKLAKDGAASVVQELINIGANPEALNDEGKSALDIAILADNEAATSIMKVIVEKNKSKRYFDALTFLQRVPLFARLPRAELPALAEAFTDRVYQPGQDVIIQGEEGTEFFVIQHGTAIVRVDDRKVNELGKNDYFGEMAILKKERRNATIKSSSDGPLNTRVLTRQAFEDLGLRKKLNFKKRQAIFKVSAETVDDQEKAPKTKENLDFLVAAFKANKNFSEMLSHSSKEELVSIAEQAAPISLPANFTIMEEGDVQADLFYVLESGTCELKVAAGFQTTLFPGRSFGELALMYRAPRKATIKTLEPTMVWALSRAQLHKVLDKTLRKKIEEFRQVLSKVELLKDLDRNEMESVANAVVQVEFRNRDCIITQGAEGDTLYILINGSVAVEVNGKQVAELAAKAEKEEYQFFGEGALLNDEVRGASVRVTSSSATALVLDQATFKKVSAMKNIKSKSTSVGQDQFYYTREKLVNLGALGKGAFGLVTMQKDPDTGVKFALKALSKGYVVLQQQETCVANEKHIMRMTDSKFLVRLAATFDGPEHVEFLMEAAMGGEVYTIYQRNDFYGNEAMARFFTACAGAGLSHLHEHHVVYRDLKPENLLLDARGYGKVADFGLAKFVMGPAYTFCGTADFMAPEIIDPKGYSVAVDWWSLGILAFEFMMGETPFEGDDPMQIMGDAKGGLKDAKFKGASGPWTEYVRAMLAVDPMRRLPMRSGGFQNFEAHAWYSTQSDSLKPWDWRDFYQQTLRPPYEPPLQDENNLDNFDAGADDPPQVPYENPGSGWEDDFDDPIGPLPKTFLSPEISDLASARPS